MLDWLTAWLTSVRTTQQWSVYGRNRRYLDVTDRTRSAKPGKLCRQTGSNAEYSLLKNTSSLRCIRPQGTAQCTSSFPCIQANRCAVWTKPNGTLVWILASFHCHNQKPNTNQLLRIIPRSMQHAAMKGARGSQRWLLTGTLHLVARKVARKMQTRPNDQVFVGCVWNDAKRMTESVVKASRNTCWIFWTLLFKLDFTKTRIENLHAGFFTNCDENQTCTSKWVSMWV